MAPYGQIVDPEEILVNLIELLERYQIYIEGVILNTNEYNHKHENSYIYNLCIVRFHDMEAGTWGGLRKLYIDEKYVQLLGPGPGNREYLERSKSEIIYDTRRPNFENYPF